jgi:beta-glucosidase
MSEYDITKGFTYMYFDGKPAYAFGHGLSYTTFEYGSLKLSSNQIASGGQVTVQAEIKNSGPRTGEEVVQLYVHQAGEKRPREQLAGFARISLKAGESRTVSFLLPAEQLAYWDSDQKMFVVQPGDVDVMLGSASDDIRQKAQFQITTAGRWPPSELTTRVSLGQ